MKLHYFGLLLFLSALNFSCTSSVAETDPQMIGNAVTNTLSPKTCELFVDGKINTKDCAEGEFCFSPKGECKDISAKGICKEKSQICTKIYKPVCGCDNNTYPNECVALSKGISVKIEGDCNKAID